MFKMNKSVAAHKLNNKILLQAYSFTPVTDHLDGRTFILEDVDNDVLGKTILKVLEQSQTSQNYILDKNKVKYMWEEVGFKTWKPFAKRSYSVSYELKKNKIIFYPKRLSSKGYYEGISNKAITTDDLSPENLRKCLSEAFKLSENIYLDK